MVHAAAEHKALDALEPRWRKMGYSLIREPSSDQLPAFLEGVRPDAIAVGAAPSLVIEVLGGRGGGAETKIEWLRRLLDGHDDWRLEVVYAPSTAPTIEAMSPADIRAAVGRLRTLAEVEPRAALLLAWSTLEAVGRLLAPELAGRGMSSRSLVDLLVAYGHVPQSESARMRRLADERNEIAHGRINAVPQAADLDYLLESIERLSASVESTGFEERA